MKDKCLCAFSAMTTPFITVCNCPDKVGAKWTETKTTKGWLCKFHKNNKDCPNYVKRMTEVKTHESN